MVMGNAPGREDGGGSPGVEDEYGEPMEYAHGEAHVNQHAQGSYPDPMVHSPPLIPIVAYQPPLMFAPQVPMSPLTRPGEIMHFQPQAFMQSAGYQNVPSEAQKPIMITWSHGGKQVAISGSWNNWATIESMQRVGKDFMVVKVLLPGVYRYRYFVDQQMRYSPDSPWEYDVSGNGYNILDVEECVQEAPETLAEFESPPSPVSSYDNTSVDAIDFSKLPPELPPQLNTVLLNGPPSDVAQPLTLQRPHHTMLDHFYMQDHNGGQHEAIGTTSRFLRKFVTVVLYKPSRG